ncbi:MAG: NHL repeat-containing protein [Verrucomicrobiota bacterium]
MMKPPILILPLLLLCTAFAELPNYPTFTSVLGQTDFTSNQTSPVTASSMDSPEGITVDPTTGKLFVADLSNHRILRFSSSSAYQTGAAAEAVLGQTDFDQSSSGLSATKFSDPTIIFVDNQGRLWVGDRDNSRVLRFDNASAIGTGAPANAVIGQPDFDSDDDPAGTPHSKLDSPTGIFVTPNGTLWIADTGFDRILRFDNAATLNGEVAADQVIGQPDFSTFAENTTRNGLTDPFGIWIDGGGNLYVCSLGNSRVLRYDDIESAGNGPNASIVIGQPDFVTGTSGDGPQKLSNVYYLGVSPSGTLWVGDYSNYRFLGYRNAANLPSNPIPDIVVGQPDLNTDTERTISNQDFASANSIAFGRSGSIFFCDWDGNRILRYSDPVSLTLPKRKKTRRNRTTLRGTSSGAELVQYRVKGQRGGYRTAKGTAENWNARIRKLSRRKTLVFARAWAFDNRLDEGRTRVIYQRR